MEKLVISKFFIAFLFLVQFAPLSWAGARVDNIEIDFDTVEILTNEDAYDMVEGIIKPRIKDKYSNCRISPKGLSSSTHDYIPFKEIMVSYELIYDKDAWQNDAFAVFYKKEDQLKLCQIRLSVPAHQKSFDWQEKLLTNSMLALGAELSPSNQGE